MGGLYWSPGVSDRGVGGYAQREEEGEFVSDLVSLGDGEEGALGGVGPVVAYFDGSVGQDEEYLVESGVPGDRHDADAQGNVHFEDGTGGRWVAVFGGGGGSGLRRVLVDTKDFEHSVFLRLLLFRLPLSSLGSEGLHRHTRGQQLTVRTKRTIDVLVQTPHSITQNDGI